MPVFVLVYFDIDSKERDIMGSHLGLSGGNRRETAGILQIGWKLIGIYANFVHICNHFLHKKFITVTYCPNV